MQFKEALRAAGLVNPGRTTWSGVAADGAAVFTIWEHEVHQINGRWFAYWSHGGSRDSDGELPPLRKAHARAFIQRATDNLGRPCRAVVLTPKFDKHGKISAARAEYPHPTWGKVVFRTTDFEALQFIAELSPPNEEQRNGT